MDKNAIKKFAVWARTELIARVSLKGVEYGITEDNIEDANADSVGGKVLTADEKKQRQALIAEINDKGYKQVMEEVAYTWFNRFSALRFMEVNGYLPSHVRVFTDEENNFKPQIITEAIHLDLDGLDMEKVYELKDAEKTEELYKYLLIVQCNALNKILPGMFQKIADYTELLLPDNLLREGSVIQQMIELIPEDDWKDAVQIIGWLYQYYNSEKKDDVFAALKKNVKITKENIPAATQLFTPDWIVRYMVENSLGRLWLEGHPDVKEQLLPTEEEQSAYAAGNRDPEDTKWHYYLEEAEQEPEVQTQLAEIRKEYAALTPDQLKVIDPCSGSGHILAYMFDVLMKIYESYGYTTREAVASIVENNLYGLDIDDRAAQLAYFAVMMKARQYDRRFFSRGIQPHVYAIVESNHVDKFAVDYFCNGDMKLTASMDTIIKELHDAKEYGSILTVTPQDWSALYDRFAEITEDINMSRETALRELLPLVQVAEALAQKYDVVVTNPPYMGASSMGSNLTNYAKKQYPDSKSDLFAIFIDHCEQMTRKNGFQAMITQHTWMFLSSFEKLRAKLRNICVVNMAHLGARAFEEIGGEVVQTTSFVFRKAVLNNHNGVYCRLVESTTQQAKEDRFLSKRNRYIAQQIKFLKIPGNPLAYWVSDKFANLFEKECVRDVATACIGMRTGNNDRFLRLWYEVKNSNIYFSSSSRETSSLSGKKWFPYNKGGDYRKWFGNNNYLVDWENNGLRIKSEKNHCARGKENYFNSGITWSDITSGKPSFRFFSEGYLFDASGPSFFPREEARYILALVNTDLVYRILSLINPTIHLQIRNFSSLPLLRGNTKNSIDVLAQQNISIAKSEWDSRETSWDFTKNQLAVSNEQVEIKEAYNKYCDYWKEKFFEMHRNEEELNRLFIEIYGLQDEMTPDVDLKDITLLKKELLRRKSAKKATEEDEAEEAGLILDDKGEIQFNKEEVIKQLISYAIGCNMGRYSIDKEGLVIANSDDKLIVESGQLKVVGVSPLANPNNETEIRHTIPNPTFIPDAYGIIPVVSEDGIFTNDLLTRFIEFVGTVYGKDTLKENLDFIACALEGKDSVDSPKETIKKYLLKDFITDHIQRYSKRPIYWMFNSGKENGFNCLVYMHRYNPMTIAQIRTDYLLHYQGILENMRNNIENELEQNETENFLSASDKKEKSKKLKDLSSSLNEISKYAILIKDYADRKIPIDLDDGVAVNYAKFKDLLVKIK